jgi:hypothetical protein
MSRCSTFREFERQARDGLLTRPVVVETIVGAIPTVGKRLPTYSFCSFFFIFLYLSLTGDMLYLFSGYFIIIACYVEVSRLSLNTI